MMENIDWLQVVIDYGKRFPTRKVKDLGLEFNRQICDTEFEDLENDGDCWLVPHDNDGRCVFSTLSENLKYNSIGTVNSSENIIPVPDHILLRLLTEGKEDLI